MTVVSVGNCFILIKHVKSVEHEVKKFKEISLTWVEKNHDVTAGKMPRD